MLDSAIFDGSLFRPSGLLGCRQTSAREPIEVEVTHNRVGRDLTFAPFDFVAGAVRHIDLSVNRVEGEMHVQLPTAAKKGSEGIAWNKGDLVDEFSVCMGLSRSN